MIGCASCAGCHGSEEVGGDKPILGSNLVGNLGDGSTLISWESEPSACLTMAAQSGTSHISDGGCHANPRYNRVGTCWGMCCTRMKVE